MKKLKLFIENMLVYGLGGVISKLIPLIMVPVITRLMPDTTYFGLSDLSTTLVSFASALALMGMYDAMYRLFFEREDESFRKNVCSTALTFTVFVSVVVFAIMVILREPIAQFFFEDPQYAYLVYITAIATLVGATNNIVAAPTRMQNRRVVYIVANTISPILSYSISIPLILKGYYTIALPLANLISVATMELTFAVLNRKWFSLRKFDFALLKQMLVIAVPLLPNFLVYWVFNSSNKLIITNLLGIGVAGVYSVSSKLGQVSQLIYTAFSGGWQYFAFSTMKDDDQVKSNSLIFEYLGIISFCASAFIFAWSELIFKLLFTGEYVAGYIAAPYLFFAPLLQMLFQVGANQFIVVKKTWPNVLILSAGAVVNIAVNVVLVPVLGIEGAAIASLLGYAVSNTICVIVLSRMNLMVISGRFYVSAAAMVAFVLVWRMFTVNFAVVSTVLAVVLSAFYIILYKKDLFNLFNTIKRTPQEGHLNDHAE